MRLRKIGNIILKILEVLVLSVAILLIISVIYRTFQGYNIPSYEIKAGEEIPIDMSLVTENLSIHDLEEMNDDNLDIHYSFPETIIPRSITGIFSTKKIFTSEDAVYAILSVRDILNIERSSFACTDMEDRDEEMQYSLQQMYKGVPVESGYFVVRAAKNGLPVLVSGRYIPIKDMNVVPKISAEEAQKKVRLQKYTRIENYQLIISGESLAWKMHVVGWGWNSGKLEVQRTVYVDATTGKTICAYNPVDGA